MQLDTPPSSVVCAPGLTLGEPDIDLTRRLKSTIELKANGRMLPFTTAGYRVPLDTNGLNWDSSLTREHGFIYICN